MSDFPLLDFLAELGPWAAFLALVWWRLDKLEHKLEHVEKELREVIGRLGRVEGRVNGLYRGD